MRGIFNSAHATSRSISQFIGWLTRRHFGNQIGGSLSGVCLLVPFTPRSALLDWSEQSVGLGHELGSRRLELLAGRFRVVFCFEPSAA